MSAAQGYLLDTNIVLHATREKSPVSLAVDSQFQLRSSPFRPTICEVTVAELWAFAQSWGEKRTELLKQTIGDLLVLPIGDSRIHLHWAELYSFARANGMAIQHDHNDVWIAAVAHVTGLKLISTDGAAYLPLRGTPWVDVAVLDPQTGIIVP
ncbi:MAG: type II toxin-antitoxin system VapC family toxin [Verrucomicrobiota bacterium]